MSLAHWEWNFPGRIPLDPTAFDCFSWPLDRTWMDGRTDGRRRIAALHPLLIGTCWCCVDEADRSESGSCYPKLLADGTAGKASLYLSPFLTLFNATWSTSRCELIKSNLSRVFRIIEELMGHLKASLSDDWDVGSAVVRFSLLCRLFIAAFLY